ncbi:MAG: exodeoxyribonuclease VII small subunit [Acutalibacteraceae bacterium]|nr:exodeoxyribonuclease VII small subunit [Acutalibacteraceae bacterium]
MAKKKTYEEALARLEEVVALLEKGNTTLEESLKLFEEGTKLSSYCYKTLNTAQQKVIELTKEDIKEGEG